LPTKLCAPARLGRATPAQPQPPFVQVLLPLQAMPQALQFKRSVCRFTQAPDGQRVRPGAQTQVPALHISVVGGQEWLHVPQWVWLVRVSVQLPLQSIWPDGQPQTPLLHTHSSFPQVLKQAPQLVRSVALLTQVPLHSSGRALCGSQTQPPAAVQTRPVPVGQTLPQPRQLFGSV
jgi:hypothetical protein